MRLTEGVINAPKSILEELRENKPFENHTTLVRISSDIADVDAVMLNSKDPDVYVCLYNLANFVLQITNSTRKPRVTYNSFN